MYIFQGDTYCDDCAQELMKALHDPPEHEQEDSDAYPQSVLPSEADSPQHCAYGEDCLNAVEVDDGEHKVGVWLENDLTSYGEQYVKNAVSNFNGLCRDYWKECYSYLF